MMPLKRLLPWIVVSGWLVGMCGTFWYFEYRTQRSFAAPGLAVGADPAARAAARRWFGELAHTDARMAGGAALTVVHVYRDGCDCNRFTESHLAQIEARFRGDGVRFVRIERHDAGALGMPGWVSSLPAAFVFGADGSLLYFGPYSDAAWCGRSGALVEAALERALRGTPPQPLAVSAWGCFCDSSDEGGKELST